MWCGRLPERETQDPCIPNILQVVAVQEADVRELGASSLSLAPSEARLQPGSNRRQVEESDIASSGGGLCGDLYRPFAVWAGASVPQPRESSSRTACSSAVVLGDPEPKQGTSLNQGALIAACFPIFTFIGLGGCKGRGHCQDISLGIAPQRHVQRPTAVWTWALVDPAAKGVFLANVTLCRSQLRPNTQCLRTCACHLWAPTTCLDWLRVWHPRSVVFLPLLRRSFALTVSCHNTEF